MNTRNTKQKEIIYKSIVEDKSHPTINEIIDKINAKKLGIGQATIYRNLNKLVKEGYIDKITFLDSVHYDGNRVPHNHFVCCECGKIMDLFDDDYKCNKEIIEDKYSFKISKIHTTYEGVCLDCQGKR